VVAVIFQSVFHLKIYQNNIFLFFKINVLKWSKNTKIN
jgi:hypothetical protein